MDKKEKFKVYNTDMSQAEKEKALADTIAQIEKTYGKGSIMRMTDSVATLSPRAVCRLTLRSV